MFITIDFETRSTAKLFGIGGVGAWKYAKDPTTDVVCAAFRDPSGQEALYLPPWSWPICMADLDFQRKAMSGEVRLLTKEEVTRMVDSGLNFEAHNAGFEMAIWNSVMVRYGFPPIEADRWYCSSIKSVSYGWPPSLEKVVKQLVMDAQKDMEGNKCMKRICKPRKAHKGERDDLTYWDETPAKFARVAMYCLNDVIVEHAVSAALPDIPETEWRLYHETLKVNERGVYIDIPFVQRMHELVKERTGELNTEMRLVTGGLVVGTSKAQDLIKFVNACGVPISDLKETTVLSTLASLPVGSPAHTALKLRREGASMAVKKFPTMLDCADDQKRVHDHIRFYGASATGRWSGEKLQTQNMTRGTVKYEQAMDMICTVRGGMPRAELEERYGDIIRDIGTNCVRGSIMAGPGLLFDCQDYSAIEGRVTAWVAGEASVLKSYADGLDIYKVNASALHNVSYDEVTGDQRQEGKTQELALGFLGGVGALKSMAEKFGSTIPDDKAQRMVDAFRQSRPETVLMGNQLDKAATDAFNNPNTVYEYRGVAYLYEECYLKCRLPSGRILYYPKPHVRLTVMPWTDRKGAAVEKQQLFYWGLNDTRQWVPKKLYRSVLLENVVQALARDLLGGHWLQLKDQGYPGHMVMLVHDELVAEVPEAYTGNMMAEVMSQPPAWCPDLPLEVAGWRGKRYRKD